MKKVIAACISLLFTLQQLYPCTNFLITKGATADGSTLITYAADSHLLYGELYFWAGTSNNAPSDSLTVLEWDTGKKLGKIAQVESTYQVVGNMNEHQLAIGETTFGGRPELVDTLGIIDYGSLIYLTLQRAKTAREAIATMDKLVTEYGYYSSGESFSIADPNEVWIMEMIGKGAGNKGAVWVALRIPDGYVSGHANQARITTFPMNDTDNCLYSEDVIEFARAQGYFSGTDNEFSFSDTYAPVDFGSARFCEARVWTGFNKVTKGMNKYLDYAMGFDLHNRMPLWVKVDEKLTLQDVQAMMRDYFQDTPMDMAKDAGAGPYGNIVRWRPLTWEVDGVTYFNERAISTQQTGFSFIAQCRNWLPDPIGGILWFGVDDTYSTVYVPMYCGIAAAPSAFSVGNGSLMEFSDSSAFWVFNQVSNFAYTRYNAMIPYIQEKQKLLEDEFIVKTKAIDSKASELYQHNVAKAITYLTENSHQMSTTTLHEWKNLYGFLFTRYMDGNVKTKVDYQRDPELEQPGYDENWYRYIINQTGDKFKYQGEESH